MALRAQFFEALTNLVNPIKGGKATKPLRPFLFRAKKDE